MVYMDTTAEEFILTSIVRGEKLVNESLFLLL